MSALLLAVFLLQSVAPLRKSDLVRLLSGSALSPVELVQLVRRNCLTFEPTDRDRNDLRLLGADATILAALDGCAVRPAPRRVAVVTAAPTAAPLPAPAAMLSAMRSGFVSGGGQRASAGMQLPRAVVFEVRDSAGAPLAGQVVSFTGINARIDPAAVATDATGQARAGVTLGGRVGSATVIATIGVLERQVAFNVAAGPADQLVVMCGAGSVAAHFAIRPDSTVELRVVAQDGFANSTPLLGLRAAVADARIFRVLRVTQDSAAGMIALKPDQPGTTSLAVIANGMRAYLTVTVPPRASPGKIDCR